MRSTIALLLLPLAVGCAHAKRDAPIAGDARAEVGGGAPAPAGPSPGTHSTVAPPGEFSVPAFQDFMRTRVPAIVACHERALAKDPRAGGRVVVRFVIATDGRLTGVEALDGDPEAAAVADCIVEAMGTWRTPLRPREPVALEYPFAFSTVR